MFISINIHLNLFVFYLNYLILFKHSSPFIAYSKLTFHLLQKFLSIKRLVESSSTINAKSYTFINCLQIYYLY